MLRRSKTHYQVGCGKADITAYKENIGMMGYGMLWNIVKGQATPLYARAFVILDKKTGSKVCLVNGELAFYTVALKDAVLKKLQSEHPELGYTDSMLQLSAQHTHSGPGGYSHYMMYNITIPGFQPDVFNQIVDGTVSAILQAENSLQDARLKFTTGNFSPEVKVAFNRSLKAYNANPEIKNKVYQKDKHLAIDRSMKMLSFETPKGEPICSINWFGVHTTSISNDNNLICYDNKGYAAEYLEKNMAENGENDSYIAAFAQDIAGDVTPNYKFDYDKKWMRGKYKDDYKSAKFNGRLQYKKAKQLVKKAQNEQQIQAGIDHLLMYVDFSNVEVDRQFADGKKGLRTAPSSQGISFLEGTDEGPGIAPPLATVGRMASTAIMWYEKTLAKLGASSKRKKDIDLKYKVHGNKHIFMETGKGKVLGTFDISNLILPSALDYVIKTFKKLDEDGFTKRTPWLPRILPLQIVTIGELAILGIAAEVTTVAGQRLKETAMRILKHKGIRQIIIGAYSNGYHGYITTPEEYDQQCYEGGHTVFGKWTLPAYQTKLRQLCLEMLKPIEERQVDTSVQPDIFSEEEIWYGYTDEKLPYR